MKRVFAIVALFAGLADGQIFNPPTALDIKRAGGALAADVVKLNPSIVITNNATWDGWTTTGVLIGETILLGNPGEWLLSPVYTNGIASVSAETWSHQDGTSFDFCVYTNGVIVQVGIPWRYSGQIRYEALSSLPGSTFGVYISKVVVRGYSSAEDASKIKELSNVRVIDAPENNFDVVNKKYSDEGRDQAIAHADAALSGYAADEGKTLFCTRLRIGEGFELVGGGGDIWAVNGCQIGGNGELISSADGIGITRNGRALMSFRDSASGLFITNFNLAAWTIDIATNGIAATPFIEFSPSMDVQDWRTLPGTGFYTGAVYRITIAAPPTNTVGFFRAMQPVGSSAVVIAAETLSLSDANGARWALSVTTNGTWQAVRE